ncbi:uncharacterized protein VTP21DRAFT_8471 [Calcarisporiella thermophila]|uniref:uncharacterized protein n=1 Tax=Calcarisporiella thermophila TaxID=911321 RepID=UPI0037439388
MHHRRKPFSAKQKKRQLQEKRAKKAEKPWSGDRFSFKPTPDTSAITAVESDSSDSEPGSFHLNQGQVNENAHSRPSAVPRQKHTPHITHNTNPSNRHASVFERLPPAIIEKSRRQSMKPFRRLPLSALEVSFEEVYPETITFPTRPAWSFSMTKDELDEREATYFQGWLEGIYARYPVERLSFFEHNLEVWRQLWRVLEMSDVLLLLVDIRHPVLHFPPALYDYVINELRRKMVVVFNKCDLVSDATLFAWTKYFEEKFPGLHIAHFSCYPRDEKLLDDTAGYALKNRVKRPRKRYYQAYGVKEVLTACKDVHVEKQGVGVDWEEIIRRYKKEHVVVDSSEEEQDEEDQEEEEVELAGVQTGSLDAANGEESGDNSMEGKIHVPHESMITIGLIGHPNVGKSSLINSIMGKSVVSASRTPGHTKHFQTIHLTSNVRLCDSPGLVFPSLLPRPLQVLSGMYPIAQVQEPYSIIQFLAERVPLEAILGLDPPDYQWSAWAICEAFAQARGFFTSKAARPDVYRAANLILRLANDGRILLTFKPPGFFTTNRYLKLRVLNGEHKGNTKEKASREEGNIKGKEEEEEWRQDSEEEEEAKEKGIPQDNLFALLENVGEA